MKKCYQKNLLNSKATKKEIDQDSMAKLVAALLFSQGTTEICSEIYPKQSEYFRLKQDTIMFVSDKNCPLL